MYLPREVKPGIYWVGVVDWNTTRFDSHHVDRGTTYNSYLIVDEKIALIDTCEEAFFDEMISRISQVVDPSKIDYIISSHVEQDHSATIPHMLKIAPNATVLTSDHGGLSGLQGHYGDFKNFKAVKTGDSISLGKRTLQFYQTVMVHWPDNMVTYCPEEKILFSNDAFGQHFASGERFDDEVSLPKLISEAKEYYATIVMPYSAMVVKALDALKGLDIEMILTGHGISWRSHIPEIMKAYERWSTLEPDEEAIVVYDSMYRSTEAMALQMVEAFQSCEVPVRLFNLHKDYLSDIMREVLTARYIAVGSPTMNSHMMPNVAAFITALQGLAPQNKNRIGIPFGSYGWVPAGPQSVAKGLEACNFSLELGTFTHQWKPNADDLKALHDKVVEGIKQIQAKGKAPVDPTDA